MSSTPFNPLTQNFTLIGKDGVTVYNISLKYISTQRIQIANICISYSVQLGLTLMSLITFILLNPTYRMKKPLHVVNTLALLMGAVRLIGFVMLFPGRLVGYYSCWTHDLTFVPTSDFTLNTIANSCIVIQYALIETALMLQVYAMATTWRRRWVITATAVAFVLAVSVVLTKSVWVVHHTELVRNHGVPVKLDSWGEAGTLLGALSIFYFCGLFFVHIATHLRITKGLIRRRESGLTSLEILAVGNGFVMLLPTVFAAIDIATDLGNNAVLPFDAGSWVETTVCIGLPLTSLVAVHRGEGSRMESRRLSFFINSPLATQFPQDMEGGMASRLDSSSIHLDPNSSGFTTTAADRRSMRTSTEPTFLTGMEMLASPRPGPPTRQNTMRANTASSHQSLQEKNEKL